MADESKFGIMGEKEHICSKAMYSGTFERTEEMLAISEDKCLYITKGKHSPALRKIIDEPRANAFDNSMKHHNTTQIQLSINRDTGEVTITNNGPGIPITKKNGMYLPEMVFTQLRAGSNLYTDENHSVAGMNGLGIKLTNIHSSKFSVVTIDPKRKLKYTQLYENGFDTIHEPVIVEYHNAPYTRVKFTPNYTKFQYTLPFSDNDYKELIDIMRYELTMTSCALQGKVSVFLGNELIIGSCAKDVMNFMVDSPDTYNIKATHNKFMLNYSIFVGHSTEKKVTAKKVQTLGIINGCITKDGTHNTVIRRKINAVLKDIKGDRTINIDNYMTIVTIATLPVANWGSQNKDQLTISENVFKDFVIHETTIKKIAKHILDISKFMDMKKRTCKKQNKKLLYDKYIPPKGKHSDVLFLVEGDSATQLVIKIRDSKYTPYSVNNTGIFSLGGVPQNVSKHMIEMKDLTGKLTELVDEQFLESKVFGSLINILKLDIDVTYDTVAELKKLPFNKIIICVDQDTDGIGNICGLVIHMFHKLWPNLFTHGYICHWNSPIVRIVHNGKTVTEYKYETQFKHTTTLPKGEIKYIKGLAGHDDKFVPEMAKSFNSSLIYFNTNADTKNAFEIYYGRDSSTRKTVLSTPYQEFTLAEINSIESSKQIAIPRHLSGHVKLFMLNAIARTLPGLDDMTPVKRKSYTVFLKHMSTTSKKVFQMTGKIADEMLYHHGSTSMDNCIIKVTQAYPGSNIFPLLEGDGQFGSRKMKGKDAGSPRYIGVKLNKKIADALFPKEDLDILPKMFEDGVEVEPQYYVPCLPLCILETRKAVSFGWQHKRYARDLNSVVSILNDLIKDKHVSDDRKNIPPSTYMYKGKIFIEDGIVHAEIMYENNPGENKIIITELPLFMNPNKYAGSFVDNPLVTNIINYSSDDKIEIVIEMVPKYMEKIKDLDGFLKAKQTFKEELNYVNEYGCIEHFDSIYDVLLRSFNLNKIKYVKRAEREMLILKYLIMREENILKFLQNLDSDVSTITKLYKKTDDMIDTILDVDGYSRINTTVLNSHKKYTTEQLEIELEKNKEYNYIKSIQIGDCSDKKIESRQNKLQEYKDALSKLLNSSVDKPFPHASIYMQDIKNAYKVLTTFVNV